MNVSRRCATQKEGAAFRGDGCSRGHYPPSLIHRRAQSLLLDMNIPQASPPFAAGYTRFFAPHIPSLSPIETTPGSTHHVRLSSRTSLPRVGERLTSLHAEEKLLVRPDAAQQHALIEVEGIGMERNTRSRSQQEEHTRQGALIEREVFGYEERLGHALELR